jgi:aromatic-L-amino-acid decarboxylase
MDGATKKGKMAATNAALPHPEEKLSDLFGLAESIASSIDEGPVTHDASAEEVRQHLRSRFDFSAPMPREALVSEVMDMLRRWTVHVTHRRYLGLFNPSVTPASVVADTLVAAYNPQLAAWSHAPAANEIERFTLEGLMELFGLDPDSGTANFTTGGAEANLSALLAALVHRFPDFPERGARGLPAQPVAFLSEQSHHSVLKAAQVSGLGRAAVRTIQTDREGRIEVHALAKEIRTTRDAGETPFLVVGTAGSTSTGVIDPLEELGDLCTNEGLWFHVDAAWGGAAALSPRLRPYLAGIELADSITCDAHKWFSVSMGAGMFFCRHQDAVLDAFQVRTPYMPISVGAQVREPFATSVQWSRRFIGLKLFMSLAEMGLPGYARMIERQAELGEYLRERLVQSGWTVLNSTPLPVVCFTKEGLDVSRILPEIYRQQVAWISEVPVRGAPALRACITSFRTREHDIDQIVGSLDEIVSRES